MTSFLDKFTDSDGSARPLMIRLSNDACSSQVFEEQATRYRCDPMRITTISMFLAVLPSLQHAPAAISIDQYFFEEIRENFREFMAVLETTARLRFPHDETPKFFLLIHRTLSREEIKLLKSCNIAGVIPRVKDFGYQSAVSAYDALLGEKQDWWPAEYVTKPAARTAKTGDISLTGRQQEVQKLLCERGLSNKAIARQLNISESTVKIHVSAILKRYGVRNRTQLALAVNNGARL